jgi:predicted nucleic acid-binding protein
MIYLLDSNALSDFYDPKSVGHQAIYRRLSRLPSDARVLMSILSLYEFEYGYANAPIRLRPAIRAKITEAQEDFELIPLSRSGARLFGDLKVNLKLKRQMSTESIKKHTIDLMFAAEAMVCNATLVSADRIFAEIQRHHADLKLENWLRFP